jgi:hypothetical protein
MNSREKGKRGERQWRDELRANGYAARRGQQFAGSPESPDVVCDSLPWIHFEVKAVERLRIQDAIDQARADCGRRIPVVVHRRNFRRWLVTMEAETFFKFLRGDLPPQAFPNPTQAPLPAAGSGASGAEILTEDGCPGQQPQREKGNEKENV